MEAATNLSLPAFEEGAAPGAAVATSAKERKKAAAVDAVRLLPKLLDACIWGRQEDAHEVGAAIAAAIEASHPALAERITKRLGQQLRPKRFRQCPDNLVDVREPRHGLAEVILAEEVLRECKAIIDEHRRAAELAKFKLAPRHKVLLYGPPGNGKTMLAEGLARELDIPFLAVKYAGLVESYLGQTGKNMQEIFEYAETAQCLVFMDEFDGVAIDRSDSRDVGEIRRVTNQLLLQMDRLSANCVFVAATNAEGLLDKAIRRRFDFVVEITAPTPELKLRCAGRELAVEMTPGYDVSHLAAQIAALDWPNLSALADRCRQIRRDLVLNQGRGQEWLVNSL